MNSKGMTLVEVMIAVAVAGVIGLGVSTMSWNMNRSSATAANSQDQTQLMYEVDGILNHAPVCTAAIGLGKFANINGTEVKLSSNIQAGGVYGKLGITSVSLTNITPIVGNNYSAIIAISGTKQSVVYGSNLFNSAAPVYYSIAGGKIANCLSTSSDPQANCVAAGGTWLSNNTCSFCTSLGGTLNGTTCSLAAVPPGPSAGPSPSGSPCTVVAGTTWTDSSSTLTCQADNAVTFSSGAVTSLTDTVQPLTGSVTASCNNGMPAIIAGSNTCTCMPCKIPAGTTWTNSSGTATCTSDATATATCNSSISVTDSTSGTSTGSVKFSCNSGVPTVVPGTNTCVAAASPTPKPSATPACAGSYGLNGKSNVACDGYCNGDTCNSGDPLWASVAGIIDECGTSPGCTTWTIRCNGGRVNIVPHNHHGPCP